LQPVLARLEANRNSDGHVFAVVGWLAHRHLSRACDRLGYKHFTQRGLRAMLIKRLYDAGVPVKRIAAWQGHSDGGALIQNVYTEVFCDNDAAAEAADLAKVGGSISLESVSALRMVAGEVH
jgi:integrase